MRNPFKRRSKPAIVLEGRPGLDKIRIKDHNFILTHLVWNNGRCVATFQEVNSYIAEHSYRMY
jgi:hypothetical protein